MFIKLLFRPADSGVARKLFMNSVIYSCSFSMRSINSARIESSYFTVTLFAFSAPREPACAYFSAKNYLSASLQGAAKLLHIPELKKLNVQCPDPTPA